MASAPAPTISQRDIPPFPGFGVVTVDEVSRLLRVFDGAVCIGLSKSAGVTGARVNNVEVGFVYQAVSISPWKDRRPSSILILTESSLRTKNSLVPLARIVVSRCSYHASLEAECRSHLTAFQSRRGLSATLLTSSWMWAALDSMMTLCAALHAQRYACLSSGNFVQANLLSIRRPVVKFSRAQKVLVSPHPQVLLEPESVSKLVWCIEW